MKRTLNRSLCAIILGAILLAAMLAGCSSTPKVDWQVRVTGAVGTPLEVSYAELTKMPQVDFKDILMQKSRGEDEVHSFSGVPLAHLFEKAGVAEVNLITAVAADGYAIEISKDELKDGIIALKADGEWIAKVDKEHGPLRLVFPNTPANRWVFQIQEIQVQ